MIRRDSVAGAIKAVALAVAILAGVKVFSALAVSLGLYSIEKGWVL